LEGVVVEAEEEVAAVVGEVAEARALEIVITDRVAVEGVVVAVEGVEEGEEEEVVGAVLVVSCVSRIIFMLYDRASSFSEYLILMFSRRWRLWWRWLRWRRLRWRWRWRKLWRWRLVEANVRHDSLSGTKVCICFYEIMLFNQPQHHSDK
jgi:hypothetical protein